MKQPPTRFRKPAPVVVGLVPANLGLAWLALPGSVGSQSEAFIAEIAGNWNEATGREIPPRLEHGTAGV